MVWLEVSLILTFLQSLPCVKEQKIDVEMLRQQINNIAKLSQLFYFKQVR